MTAEIFGSKHKN